jgi:membrane fusion protein, multidrug efflux system
MTESRIALLATLPMLIGAALVLALRRPPLSTEVVPDRPAHASAEIAEAQKTAAPYPGVIVSGYTADVAAEVAGAVIEVLARTGVRVRAGDPLLRIDPKNAGDEVRLAQARLEQQRSAVERASAELTEATDLLTRMRSITDGISERELVAAQSREQKARAAVAEAKAGLSMTEAELGRQRTRSDKLVIRAPFEGMVVALYADPGDVVGPGQVVARVITEDFYVRFAMPPDDTSARSPGLTLEVRLPTGALLAAQVTDVQPEVDAAAQLVFARARVERTGTTADVELISGTQVQVRLAAVKKEP